MQFVLRKWNIHDAENLQYHANNPKIAANLRDNFPSPYALADAFWYINYVITQDEKRELYRAIAVDNMAVGSIGVVLKTEENNKYAELGYWLGEDYWNKGIMTRAAKMICEIAFSEYEIDYITAEIFADNIPSARVLEKAGFIRDETSGIPIIKAGQPRNTYHYIKIR